MTIEESLRAKVMEQLRPVYLQIENESHLHSGADSQTHFRLLVVSEVFEGKSRIDRQRLINDLFLQERQLGLHALTMRALTPSEWEKTRDHLDFNSPACHGGSKKT